MKNHCIHRQQWILAAFSLLLCISRGEETWSKPESSATNQDNNGWIPVQGKCLTCRPNRDLETQSTNEQIGKVLSPPLPRQQNLPQIPPPPPPPQQQQIPQLPIQPLPYVNNKQPRILPFGPNFHQFNLPFPHDNKQYQIQPTKLFPQEGQKQFYQFEGNHFPKQPFNLPQQQLIQGPNQPPPQQRYPLAEPYPFTLPLKTIEATTPKISYQPKIRFPDNDGPKQPINKIPPQNTDEIQLLYVPVETLQRQRNVKNMKDLVNQPNQFPHTIPHGFIPPQFNVQYQHVPKPENQFYFPPNFSPPSNFLHLNTIPAQKIPEQVFANISKNFLQPYFTINGLYSPLPPQIPAVPSKQPDLQFYNLVQPGILNQAPIKPEPSPLPQQINRQPNKYDFNNNLQNLQGGFVVSNGNPADIKPQGISQTFETYSQTTPETIRSTEFATEKSTPQKLDQQNEFNYQFVTGTPQTSASQNQQYISQQTAQTQPQPTQQITLNQQFANLQNVQNQQYANQQNVQNQQFANHQHLQNQQFANQQISQNQQFTNQQIAQNQQYLAQQILQNQQFLTQQNAVPKPAPSPSPASSYDDQNNYPVPHQPPLSFYMEKLHNTKINDVLYLLKDSKTIPVLDTIESEPPQVFVGPTELQPPKGYIKFELPYLSSLDYNRIERMIDRLPFFVAPLNFKPPPGYSKIPFPAPHIGSVVLSNSTVLQESLNKYDQKHKSTTQAFSAPPELSTITPQLTSQINSLIEAPAPSLPSEVKNYEESTKKPIYKNTFRPASSTETPKRNFNRQRKPIYRGYPSIETSTPYEPSSTTESPKIEQNKDDYVEFSAKGKFNFGADVSQQNPTYQPSQTFDTSYQPQKASDSYQPQPTDNTYQPQQISSTYQPSSENLYDPNHSTSNTYQSSQAESQSPNENPFSKKIASNNADFPNNQNYPFYNFDLSSSQSPQAPSEPISTASQPQNVTQESQNFNFQNIKPLSQYSHFIKKEDTAPVNITEQAISSTSDTKEDSYQFWNQNQFYKNNPNTLEYFSSTVSNQIPETTPVITEPSTVPNRFLKHSTESSIPSSEQSYPSDYQKLEVSSTEATTSHRPRTKQRIPNRFQSKYTTEKHDEEVDTSPKSIPERTNPIESDSIQQSTENNEASTRVEIKRRRRPVRPAAIVTPVTEISSSTSRSYRTRATRYPTTSTERYRARRPTTNAATEAEWNSYVNNFAPSAPAANEIVHEKKTEFEKDQKPLDNYWSEAVSIHQSQSYEVPARTAVKNSTEDSLPDGLPWNDVAAKNSLSDSLLQYSTAESYVPEKSDSTVENKTEVIEQHKQTVETSLNEKPTSEDVNPTFGTVNYSSTDDNVHPTDDKNNQEIKKDKFLTKDVDGQKKAYDPQDEKKVPGRRRGTWVRRIRVKRPQDVFETAESQNLGRITDNSVQILDSKVLSKTEEQDESSYKIKSSTTPEDFITTTEPSSEITIKTTSEKDDYENLQNNFAQMLSDFLNSNDKSVKSVNIERTNVTSENNISYVLGLESKDNSSFNFITANTPTENVNIAEETITTTTYPNSDFSDFQSTTEEALETFLPNKVLGTSTTTEISLETEICYRGKCVKTKKSKASDLLPVE